MRRAKRKSRSFNWYALAIVLCIVVIIASIIILFEQDSTFIPTAWKEKYVALKETITSIGKDDAKPANADEDEDEETNTSKNSNTTKKGNKASNTTNTNVNKEENNTQTNTTTKTETNTTTNTKTSSSDVTEEQKTKAKKVALEKFHELGETGITENDLVFIEVYHSGEKYYYADSRKNNLEIKIDTCKITEINGAKV